MQTERFSRINTFIIVIVSIIVLFWIASQVTKEVSMKPLEDDIAKMPVFTVPELATSTLQAPKKSIEIMIATSSADHEKGLGERDSLGKDSGMLFVFPNAGVFGFWMKGMRFPIDIVWIDANKRVVGVAPGVSVGSYPDVFYPPSNILFTLELNSGGAKDSGIATGTKLVF